METVHRTNLGYFRDLKQDFGRFVLELSELYDDHPEPGNESYLIKDKWTCRALYLPRGEDSIRFRADWERARREFPDKTDGQIIVWLWNNRGYKSRSYFDRNADAVVLLQLFGLLMGGLLVLVFVVYLLGTSNERCDATVETRWGTKCYRF